MSLINLASPLLYRGASRGMNSIKSSVNIPVCFWLTTKNTLKIAHPTIVNVLSLQGYLNFKKARVTPGFFIFGPNFRAIS